MTNVDTESDNFYYFAYGSCMYQESFSNSLEEDTAKYFLGPARLDNYELKFNYASVTENVCFANIEMTPDAYVEGALFELPASVLPALDNLEGVSPSRYERIDVEVSFQDMKIKTLSYCGLVTLPYEAAPSNSYREMLEKGLKDAQVTRVYSDEVIRHIESLPERA